MRDNQIVFRNSKFTVGGTITVEYQLHLVETVRFRLIVIRENNPCGRVLVPVSIAVPVDGSTPDDVEIFGDYVLASPRSGRLLWVRYQNADIQTGERVNTSIRIEPWSVIDRIADLASATAPDDNSSNAGEPPGCT